MHAIHAVHSYKLIEKGWFSNIYQLYLADVSTRSMLWLSSGHRIFALLKKARASKCVQGKVVSCIICTDRTYSAVCRPLVTCTYALPFCTFTCRSIYLSIYIYIRIPRSRVRIMCMSYVYGCISLWTSAMYF